MQEFMTFYSNHTTLFAAAFFVAGLIMIVEIMRMKRTSRFSLDPSEAVRLINHHRATIIDIRSEDLFRKGHILDAVSLPGDEALNTPKKTEKFKSKPVILVCGAGLNSQKIAPLLTKKGYNAHFIAGGMRAWADANMPIIRE